MPGLVPGIHVDARDKPGHDEETMRLIKQKNQTDCGVACVAMLADVSYAQAERILFGANHIGKSYTHKEDLIRGLRNFGITTSGHLVRCSKNPKNLKFKQDALIKTNKLKSGKWHWAVWDSRKQVLLDPYYKRTEPYSCLLIVHRGKMPSKTVELG
jgi:ABC-type bacteriocin/lantibiotic exporter with double-glycine peptidase domain